ncbi:MAG: GxxExxY protein [Planctomycetota bacterium]
MMRHDDIPVELNDLAERVIGSAIQVHRELGPGFAEKTYHRALMIQLEEDGIEFASEVPVELTYHDRGIGDGRIDLLIDDRLVVELKAAEANPDKYRRQAVCYLKATGLQLALVMNFEADTIKQGLARVVNTNSSPRLRASAPSAIPVSPAPHA